MTDWIQKPGIDFFTVKSPVQYHPMRMTLSFPTVPSAPRTESDKCPFNNVNAHLTLSHCFGAEGEARARSR